MSIVEKFLTEGSGDFASAKNTPVGSEITITHVYFDNTTFPDNPAIVVNGTRENGDEVKVRLSKQNIERLAKVLGTDEKTWIGNKIKALTHQDYPGLGKTGILWTGVKPTQQMEPVTNIRTPTLENPNINDLSTDARMWLTVSQELIGQAINDKTWNIMINKGIAKDLGKYNLIEIRDDYPYLSEEARKYL